MSKLLTVVGASGTQGYFLIETALKDGNYKIRGVTRNPSSEKAKALAARGVEIVQADVNDEASLTKAFEVSVTASRGHRRTTDILLFRDQPQSSR